VKNFNKNVESLVWCGDGDVEYVCVVSHFVYWG
jgi:hypothetical protein